MKKLISVSIIINIFVVVFGILFFLKINKKLPDFDSYIVTAHRLENDSEMNNRLDFQKESARFLLVSIDLNKRAIHMIRFTSMVLIIILFFDISVFCLLLLQLRRVAFSKS